MAFDYLPAKPFLRVPWSLVVGLGTHSDHDVSVLLDPSAGLAQDTLKAAGCYIDHLSATLLEAFQKGVSGEVPWMTPEASASGSVGICRASRGSARVLLPTGCSTGSALGRVAIAGV